MWNDGDATTIDDSGIKHMLFKNNIFWSKTGDNGFGNETHAAIRIDRHLAPRLYEDINFYNNIFNPTAAVPLEMYQLSLLDQLHVENNIFHRTNPGATGMMICGETDGTHTSVNSESARGICPGGTPAYYWSFAGMQSAAHPQIVNNLNINPRFVDVSNNYASNHTPGQFDFAPMQNSPSVDFANPAFAAPVDLRQNPRVGPADAGAYEYATASSNNPPSVNAGQDQLITYPANQVNLSGIASDDGLPNPPGQLLVQWTKFSGPGSVSFSAQNSPNTTATFSAPGLYQIRFSASDSAIFRSDLVEINVYDPNNQGGSGPGPGPGASSNMTRFVGCMDPKNPSHLQNEPICFNLASPGNWLLKIYSKTGAEVKEFSGSDAAGVHQLTWNRKDDSGNLVASGIYNLVLQADRKALGKLAVFK
jgi:hypothetical protein